MFRILVSLVFCSLVACQSAGIDRNTDSHPSAGNGDDFPVSAEKRAEVAYGTIELRMPVAEAHPEATAFHMDGKTVYLGPAQAFEAYGFESKSGYGQPALGFEIVDTQKAAFSALTESLIGKQVAILVDGKVLTMPMVNGRLEGHGVIDGGGDGYSAEEVRELVSNFNR